MSGSSNSNVVAFRSLAELVISYRTITGHTLRLSTDVISETSTDSQVAGVRITLIDDMSNIELYYNPYNYQLTGYVKQDAVYEAFKLAFNGVDIDNVGRAYLEKMAGKLVPNPIREQQSKPVFGPMIHHG